MLSMSIIPAVLATVLFAVLAALLAALLPTRPVASTSVSDESVESQSSQRMVCACGSLGAVRDGWKVVGKLGKLEKVGAEGIGELYGWRRCTAGLLWWWWWWWNMCFLSELDGAFLWPVAMPRKASRVEDDDGGGVGAGDADAVEYEDEDGMVDDDEKDRRGGVEVEVEAEAEAKEA